MLKTICMDYSIESVLHKFITINTKNYWIFYFYIDDVGFFQGETPQRFGTNEP